jgi:hypothetical protein
MSKFKAGDKVEAIRDSWPRISHPYSKGDVFTIREMMYDGTHLLFKEVPEYYTFGDNNFKIVEESIMFQINDFVTPIRVSDCEGDYYCCNLKMGEKYKVVEFVGDVVTVFNHHFRRTEAYDKNRLKLVVDRSNWHPHYDCIVAWARGEIVQFRLYDSQEWTDLEPPKNMSAPAGFYIEYQYRIKPEKSERDIEIENLEKEMEELSSKQLDIANRIGKLKENFDV